jgi:hypothetical protein
MQFFSAVRILSFNAIHSVIKKMFRYALNWVVGSFNGLLADLGWLSADGGPTVHFWSAANLVHPSTWNRG